MMRRAQRHTGPGRRDHARRSALATVLGTALAIAGCDSLPGRPREADRPLAPTQVTDFAVLWGENCSGCHGADGKLGSSTPLGDPVYLAAASDVAIRDLTLRGIPGTPMPAFAATSRIAASCACHPVVPITTLIFRAANCGRFFATASGSE